MECRESKDRNLEAYELKSLFEQVVQYHFGNIGVADPIDILGIQNESIIFVRIHTKAYNLFRSALCMTHKFDGNYCTITVLSCSSYCTSLSSTSRFLSLNTFEEYTK